MRRHVGVLVGYCCGVNMHRHGGRLVSCRISFVFSKLDLQINESGVGHMPFRHIPDSVIVLHIPAK